jgi:hypothetical protein
VYLVYCVGVVLMCALLIGYGVMGFDLYCVYSVFVSLPLVYFPFVVRNSARTTATGKHPFEVIIIIIISYESVPCDTHRYCFK